MAETDVAGEQAPSLSSRARHAAWAWLVFAVGGSVIAVATFAAVLVAYVIGGLLCSMLFGDMPSGALRRPASFDIFVGMPLVGLLGLAYGTGFVAAYLSIALAGAASIAAATTWWSGHVPVRCLAALVVTSPAIVFAQVSAFGVWFDPFAETDADALTATKISLLCSPLLVPALCGAWAIAGKRRRRRSGGSRVFGLAP